MGVFGTVLLLLSLQVAFSSSSDHEIDTYLFKSPITYLKNPINIDDWEEAGSDCENTRSDKYCHAFKGFCERFSKKGLILKGCRKTCNNCESNINENEKSDDEKNHNPIDIQDAGASSDCKNTESDSYCYKYKDFCNSDVAFFKGLMLTYCKKTCNYCESNNNNDMDDEDGGDDSDFDDEASEDCENVESDSHCDKYITMCDSDNAFFMGLMVKYCKKTCDFC